MASTITLQSTLNWAQAFLGYAPLNIGTNNEPALSSANLILQTILSPPFRWRWNRATTSFVTIAGTQDYVESLANVGFLEQAYLSGAIQLEIKPSLSQETTEVRPAFIAAQYDSGTQVTFRLNGVPDAVYTVDVDYQKAAPTMALLTDTWSPIPDYFQYIYSWGFLSLMFEYFGDGRAPQARQTFVASLLSASEGLTETERSLFIDAWLGRDSQLVTAQLSPQLGERARGI